MKNPEIEYYRKVLKNPWRQERKYRVGVILSFVGMIAFSAFIVFAPLSWAESEYDKAKKLAESGHKQYRLETGKDGLEYVVTSMREGGAILVLGPDNFRQVIDLDGWSVEVEQ